MKKVENLKGVIYFFLAMFKKVVYLKEEGEEANNNEDGLLKEYSQEVVLDLPRFLKTVQYSIPRKILEHSIEAISIILNISKPTPNYFAAKFYLLKTIFTSATLMSPELSMNTFHSWISYSRRSFLPAVNLFLIQLIDKQNITKNLYN